MKTISLKKVSALAVASLGFGLLSVVPANAAVTAVSVSAPVALTTGGSATARTATQATGNQVTFVITATGAGDLYMNTSGVGSIQSAIDTNDEAEEVDNANTSWTALNGLNFVDGAKTDSNITAHLHNITLTSGATGTQTVKIQVVDAATGLYSSLGTVTVTWLAAATEAGVDAAQSTVYLVADGSDCTFGTNKSGDVNAAAANVNAVASVPAATVVDVCFIGRNKSGTRVAAAAATTTISSAGATFGGEAAEGATGGFVVESTGAATATFIGKSTITVIFIDALGGAASLSTDLTYFGDIASISISNPDVAGGYAAAFGGANNVATSATTLAALTTSALPGTSTSGIGWLAVTAKDKGGNIINLVGTDDISGFTIDSDFTAGVPSAGTSDSAGATIAMSDGAGDISGANFGTNIALIRCGTSAVAEKLTITVIGVNSLGTKILSPASATFYCSGAVATVTVATTGTNVNVVDAKSYPVADGTSVALVASNGAVIAPATKSTVNGKFATAATFIPSSTSSTATVTAIVGSKSGTSAAIAGSGAASNQTIATQIDALNAKIVALNARIAKIMKKLGVK